MIKKYNEFLNEDRQQLEIPFDGKHPLHDKPTHVHVLDALSEMDRKNGIKVEDYISNWSKDDISNAWRKNQDGAYALFKEYILDDDEGLNHEFLRSYNPIDSPEYFTDEISIYIEENELEDSYTDIQKVIVNFNLHEVLQEYLSNKGETAKYNDVIDRLYYDKLDDYGCEYTLRNELTENGLVPLYRAINYDKGKDEDIYQNIMSYGNVGEYWSFEYGGAEAYNGGGGDTMILTAYIKPEYINWSATIYKSAWDSNDEMEVELSEGKDIMIVTIHDENSKELKLPKPFIVKT